MEVGDFPLKDKIVAVTGGGSGEWNFSYLFIKPLHVATASKRPSSGNIFRPLIS